MTLPEFIATSAESFESDLDLWLRACRDKNASDSDILKELVKGLPREVSGLHEVGNYAYLKEEMESAEFEHENDISALEDERDEA